LEAQNDIPLSKEVVQPREAGRLKRLRKGCAAAKESVTELCLPKDLEEDNEAEVPVDSKYLEDCANLSVNGNTTKDVCAARPVSGAAKCASDRETIPNKKRHKTDSVENDGVELSAEFCSEGDIAPRETGGGLKGQERGREDEAEDPLPDKENTPGEEQVLKPRGPPSGRGSGMAEAVGGAMEAFESAIRATASRASGIKSSKDGVGAAALAAAEQHKAFSLDSYVTWKAGAPTPFGFLCEAFEVVANTTKRQEKATVLIDAFRTILATRPEDLIAAVRLTANELSPPHEGLELGLGEATLKDVLADASGKTKAAIDKQYQEVGDLGSLAVEVRSRVRTLVTPPPLTVAAVLKSLREVARLEGSKAMNKKKNAISKLLVASRGNEAGYIMRACEFKRGLRIGVNDSTLLTAIAHAFHLHKLGCEGRSLADKLEETAQAVRRAFCECPCYEVLIESLLKHEISELPNYCHLVAGVPIKPMLAKPTLGISEVLDKFSGTEFTCEYKYDGERAQIHIVDDGSVQVYSRNSENSIGKYPDAAEIIKKHLQTDVKSLIIDAEVVAYDRKAGKIKPFQELSRRAKKVVSAKDIKGELCVFAFDCLYFNGDILVRKPLSERQKALRSALRETPGECQFANGRVSSDLMELQAFLDEAVNDCTEGLMVKAMDATYEPSKRSTNWLKLKKDYMTGAADSFDVVPIGAWFGKGKRTGVYGSFLLAIYNPQTEEYQTISKIGTGFSEQQLEEHSAKLREFEIPGPRNYYRYGDAAAMQPEVWFEAKAVWEVKAADLSISPMHQAARGMVEPGKGISIRFPRLVRERDDKDPEDATTAEQVVEMYQKQAVARAHAKPAAEDDDY